MYLVNTNNTIKIVGKNLKLHTLYFYMYVMIHFMTEGTIYIYIYISI